ncbi:MAG: YaeQ family protein [Rhizobacter sp.]
MALKATIYKAQLQIADMDRNVYLNHPVTLARHPSETDERMMIRLLALAMNVQADADNGQLEMAKGMWDQEEPDLWHKDLTGQIKHWIDVGQPDDKRLLKACPRADKVSVYSFSHSTPVWWKSLESKISKAQNLNVWQVPADQSQALTALAERGMQLQVTVQDGQMWFGNGDTSVEIQAIALRRATS